MFRSVHNLGYVPQCSKAVSVCKEWSTTILHPEI